MMPSRNLSLFLAVAATATNVSAQCYYAAGKLASSDYVPCGSTSSGQQQSCCHLGDNCLADGVCFSLGTGMTYIAGCTDSQYQDGTCGAQQCDKNTQIQGIAMACGQTGTWQCCTGPGQQADNPSRTNPDSCPCDQNAEPIAQNQNSFSLTAILPQSANGQILLINSAGSTTGSIPVPTASSTSTTSSTSSTEASPTTKTSSPPPSTSNTSSSGAVATTLSSSTSSTTSSSSSPSSAASSSASSAGSTSGSNSSSSSSSSNLRIILGVTIPIIVLLLAALAFFGLRYYRKRRSADGGGEEFGPGGWDPFRHQPDHRRGSRSSAVWDNNYNAAGTYAPVGTVDEDHVAQAVRQNAEEHRKHYRSDSGGLRPMSELGGFVPWKGTP